MNKDLTNSDLHRKNILNNTYVLEIIQSEISFSGVLFENNYRFTKKQVAAFFEIEDRTVDRYIESHKTEFEESGYEILTGKRLKTFKLDFGNDIHVVTKDESLKKTTFLGVFTFRAFLNIGMLLTESEKAKSLRAFILDIVLDSINKKLGGNTKYINQREEEFLPSALKEHNYRKEFTKALDTYVAPDNLKYARLTNKVYISIFKEDAKAYRQILKLKSKENVRSTMYSEVLDLISSYENGFANFLKEHAAQENQKLSLSETTTLFDRFEKLTNAIYEPLREKARGIMASRDMAFRDALHEKRKNYITPLSTEEFDKFIGKKSMALEERILNNIDVFKRLKNK